ncbi:hypothetical protein QFZ34_003271 [Phyllobacterium ifriqiyense]|uniref:Uncharacterized protein n=1 Tax=Phyllobacterium ifriqiyense TaxID=314238 RepID=A0ABU0SBE7_9HYPH|nr:hypothetical protein [Phyllobacterium ifriqiyense]
MTDTSGKRQSSRLEQNRNIYLKTTDAMQIETPLTVVQFGDERLSTERKLNLPPRKQQRDDSIIY